MRKNGAMFICNRCRKQVFAERLDDGKYDSKPLDGWALDCERICGVGNLCPDCFKAYREAMEGFWNSGKHGARENLLQLPLARGLHRGLLQWLVRV